MTPPQHLKPSPPFYFEDNGCDEHQHMPHEQQLSRVPAVENATKDIDTFDPVPLHPSACQAVQHVLASEIWDQILHDQERKKAMLEFSDLVLAGSGLHHRSNVSQSRQELTATTRSAITGNSSSPAHTSNMVPFAKGQTSTPRDTPSLSSPWQQEPAHATNHLGMCSWSTATNMLPERAMGPTEMQEDDESAAASQSSGNVDTKTESVVHQDRWDERFEELKRFAGLNGHCHVPTHLSSNPSLARWCKRQRYQYKLKKSGGHSTLTDEREDKLNNVNFVWDVHSSSWEERFLELLDFKMKYGHTNVPRSRGKLGSWVKSQRRQYSLYVRNQKSHLTPNRVGKMNSVGFEWVGSKSPFPRDEPRADNSC